MLSQQALLNRWQGDALPYKNRTAMELAELRQRVDILEAWGSVGHTSDKDNGVADGVKRLAHRVRALEAKVAAAEAMHAVEQSDTRKDAKEVDSATQDNDPGQFDVLDGMSTVAPSPCPESIGDFSSRKAMQAAGWKLDVSDAEFGAEFFGWKGGTGVGGLHLTLQGSGRLILRVANPHPERSKENVVVVRMNGEPILRANMNDDQKVCLWFKPCDVLSITEVYGQIRLKTAKAVCDKGGDGRLVRCETGGKVRWGERRCDVQDGIDGTVVRVLNETRIVVASGAKQYIVSASDLAPQEKHKKQVKATLAEAAAGLRPDIRCRSFPFKRPRVGLVVLADAQFQKSYSVHIQSQRCYTQWRGYDFFLFDSSDFPACDRFRSVFFFQKHCIVSEFLKTQVDGYAAVIIDADVVATTLERGVEEWLRKSEDIIFYTRGKEIAAGNYIVRNTPWARKFLLEWAEFISRQPKGFSSADNGAIHLHVVETLKRKGHERCAKMFAQLTALVDNLAPYFQFVDCTRQALGELGTFLVEATPEAKITILSDAKSFVVDQGVAASHDDRGPVMYHGLKKPDQVLALYRSLDRCELKSSMAVRTPQC